MSSNRDRRSVWRYRSARFAGRFVTRSAALLTFGHMPPFVSTSAIVVRGDELLVVIDPIRQEPVLPGGHVKWTETPTLAVAREVREETGLVVSPQQLVGVYSGVEWAGEPGVVRLVYEAELLGGCLTSSGEGQALWQAIGEITGSATRDAGIIREWLERGPTENDR